MMTQELPPTDVMLQAFLARDTSYDGVFMTGVATTGIFCRTTCTAKKPRPENIRFFASPHDALLEGYRPCKRCRPMEPRGAAPEWLRPLLAGVEDDPARRWTDHDMRSMGLSPERVRRWFKRHHGMTFHAYSRARRLGSALGRVKNGENVSRAAFSSGFDSLSGFQDAFRRYFGSAPTRLDAHEVVEVDRVATPLGPMLVAATSEAVCLLEFVDRRALPTQVERIRKGLKAVFVPARNELMDRMEDELAEYFAGERTEFSVPTVAPGSDFQRRVWDALTEIPYGETRSYGEVAAAIGKPAAVRALGRTNGLNALAIIVPCHRVVGADGRLVGYGGGLWRKKKLLGLEQRVRAGL